IETVEATWQRPRVLMLVLARAREAVEDRGVEHRRLEDLRAGRRRVEELGLDWRRFHRRRDLLVLPRVDDVEAFRRALRDDGIAARPPLVEVEEDQVVAARRARGARARFHLRIDRLHSIDGGARLELAPLRRVALVEHLELLD